MRFHKTLDDILGSRIKIDILRLLSRTRSDHTGREIAGLIGYSHNATRAALEELEDSGLVIRRQAGRANLYSIDADNVIFTDILTPAFETEDKLLARVAAIISKWIGDDLASVILFGSVARGDEGPGSDIDIVVIVKDGADMAEKRDSIADASLEVTRRFGNQLNYILIDESEYARKKNARKGLWREINREGVRLNLIREG
jgi:predicted nucleotidyltransferase/biotin operon repressor